MKYPLDQINLTNISNFLHNYPAHDCLMSLIVYRNLHIRDSSGESFFLVLSVDVGSSSICA